MRAMRQGHLAVIDISNDKDDDHPSEPGAGIGLENVRQRLANHYGDRASLGASREPGTFSVRLILPVEIR
jgi:LytS/YehU family sensor histidine kinase